jgi:hypothetical protein
MQNSIERLLEATAGLMRRAAASTLEDRFLAGQLSAGAEILENLATRVEWRATDLREYVIRMRDVLAVALAAADGHELSRARRMLATPAPSEAASATELERWRDEHLQALSEVQMWLGVRIADPELAQARAALKAFLRWDLDRERGLMRRGAEGAQDRWATRS